MSVRSIMGEGEEGGWGGGVGGGRVVPAGKGSAGGDATTGGHQEGGRSGDRGHGGEAHATRAGAPLRANGSARPTKRGRLNLNLYRHSRQQQLHLWDAQIRYQAAAPPQLGSVRQQVRAGPRFLVPSWWRSLGKWWGASWDGDTPMTPLQAPLPARCSGSSWEHTVASPAARPLVCARCGGGRHTHPGGRAVAGVLLPPVFFLVGGAAIQEIYPDASSTHRRPMRRRCRGGGRGGSRGLSPCAAPGGRHSRAPPRLAAWPC